MLRARHLGALSPLFFSTTYKISRVLEYPYYYLPYYYPYYYSYHPLTITIETNVEINNNNNNQNSNLRIILQEILVALFSKDRVQMAVRTYKVSQFKNFKNAIRV